ncbi:hypothetical protein [Pseudodonghicola xiamenensis]|uniref:Uncharacterized protein n=2 Tax=Pseudodonghicola xiamenensis TaxID=337702 RepID=A0A8J3MEB0_9RHOB|nr:hypothetical protein [Pseudodonghicola xiamenensis]GHH02032.1 hypothetical protein GCM10010961_39660 [Pseudodonghicola xiamenensis]
MKQTESHNIHDLVLAAERLEKNLAGACSVTRLSLQPEFSRVLDRLQQKGQNVPARMRRLERALHDEALEARFDNMPI